MPRAAAEERRHLRTNARSGSGGRGHRTRGPGLAWPAPVDPEDSAADGGPGPGNTTFPEGAQGHASSTGLVTCRNNPSPFFRERAVEREKASEVRM